MWHTCDSSPRPVLVYYNAQGNYTSKDAPDAHTNNYTLNWCQRAVQVARSQGAVVEFVVTDAKLPSDGTCPYCGWKKPCGCGVPAGV